MMRVETRWYDVCTVGTMKVLPALRPWSIVSVALLASHACGSTPSLNEENPEYRSPMDTLEPTLKFVDPTGGDDTGAIQAALDNEGNAHLRAGETYRINGVLQLGEGDVLDGHGANVILLSDETRIDVRGADAVVRDMHIDNNSTIGTKDMGRVYAKNADRVPIEILTVSEQREPGSGGPYYQLVVERSHNAKVQNNVVDQARGELIVLIGCTDCSATDNTTFGGWSGLGTVARDGHRAEGYGFRNEVSNNTVYDTAAAGVTLNSPVGIAFGNRVTSTTGLANGPGIRLGHSNLDASDWTLQSNIVSNLRDQGTIPDPSKGRGISVDYGTRITIADNQIIGCREGISVSNEVGKTVTVSGNSVSDTTREALVMWGAPGSGAPPHHATVSGNYFQTSCDLEAQRSAVTLANVQGVFSGNVVEGTCPTRGALWVHYTEGLLIDGNDFSGPAGATKYAVDPSGVISGLVVGENLVEGFLGLSPN